MKYSLVLIHLILSLNPIQISGWLQWPWYPMSCYITECCHPYSNSMPLNWEKLARDLNDNLYGQDLAKKVILSRIKHHLTDNPSKALLLSFNGVPGTGKTYVSRMILNSLFEKGEGSSFVRFYFGENDFGDKSNIDVNKKQLLNEITETVRKCPRSIFVFDEADHIPAAVLDVIKPVFESLSSVKGVDYRKSIFILMSTAGGYFINNTFMEALKNGKERESLTLNDFENNMQSYIDEDNYLRESMLMKHGFITSLIPFLPLEWIHVKQCIVKELKNRNKISDPENVAKVIKMVTFETVYGLSLSEYGCKKVDDLISYIFE